MQNLILILNKNDHEPSEINFTKINKKRGKTMKYIACRGKTQFQIETNVPSLF